MSKPVIERLNEALEGRYTLERELGEGGMATVYLAEDLKHRRNVAVKVLKPELAAVVGAERFLAEIETTASLQHPHILPLFDSGEADTFLYYVMPYVEGESLRDRLQREQQLPVEEALRIADAVAAALDYAHRQGVVHRDVKPANILLHEGEPLVADFGIALAVTQAGGGRITETGLSLGTPHYMSPEQAAGERTLDPRSDVYAVGCVLYEMLTGQPPFGGPNPQAVLGRILTGDPDPVTAHRRTVPANVEAAVLKSLQRLPADRFDTAAELARALKDPTFSAHVAVAGRSGGAPVTAGPWKAVAGVAGVVALLAVGVAAWSLMPGEPPPVIRYSMELPEGEEIETSVFGSFADISADGSNLVYVGPGDPWALWLRPRSQLGARPIPGTNGGIEPHFSPDGRRVAYIAGSELAVVSVGGEPPVTFAAEGLQAALGLDWGPDDYLYYSGDRGLFRIPATGGDSERVTVVDSATAEAFHGWPHVLPGGRGLLFTAPGTPPSDPSLYTIQIMELASGERLGRVQGIYGRYVASGHLLHVTADGTLLVTPFDLDRLETTGPAVALTGNMGFGNFFGFTLAASDEGTLVYRAGSAFEGGAMTPLRVARDGTETVIDEGWTGTFATLGLSPDGRHLAVSSLGSEGEHIWIKELDTGPLAKLTFQGTINQRPKWTADGREVLFWSDREGSGFDIWRKRSDGSGPAMLVADIQRDLVDVEPAPDGGSRLLRSSAIQSPGADILIQRAGPAGEDPEPEPLLAGSHREVSPTLSPDGRWLAYTSDESGRDEVYVRPFPEVDQARFLISDQGGNEPLWSRGGDEIFYRSGNNELVAVRVRTEPTFAVGAREALFSMAGYYADRNFRAYDVTPGDSAFVVLRTGTAGGGDHLVVVEHFFTELEEKVRR